MDAIGTGKQLEEFKQKKLETEQKRIEEQNKETNQIPFGLIIGKQYTVKIPDKSDQKYEFINETRNSDQTIKDLHFKVLNDEVERNVAYTIEDIESNKITFEEMSPSTDGGGRKRKHRKSKRRINRKKRRTRRNSKK